MLQVTFDTTKATTGCQWEDFSTDTTWTFYSDSGEVTLNKRAHYPETYAFTQGAKLLFGYGDYQRAASIVSGSLHDVPAEQFYNDEFLLVIVDTATGTITVQRDAYITLPLFYSFEEGVFRLTNDYPWITRRLRRKSVTRLSLADGLIVLPFNWHDTLSEVRILTERSRLHGSTSGAHIELPPPRVRSIKSDPHRYKEVLEQTLDTYWQRYGDQVIVYELSGGIDSSIAPGYYSRRYGQSPLTVSKLFPYDFYHSQSQKIADFTAAFGADSATVAIDVTLHYPLKYVLDGSYAAPLYRFTEIYRGINSHMADMAAKAGVTAVFTGIGGNELFERGRWAQQSFAGEAEKKRRRTLSIPFFYTERFRDMYRASINDVPAHGYPVPLAASSALHAGTARNMIYIQRGIWPVSPLSNPQLYAYTQGLEARYKDNKNIMRVYASAANFPESIVNPVRNEHAGQFFDEGVLQFFPQATKKLLDDSILIRLGLVDHQNLESVYDKVRTKQIPERTLFDLYNLVVLEHNLQALKPGVLI